MTNGSLAAFEGGLPGAPELEALLLGDAMVNQHSAAVVREVDGFWSRDPNRKIGNAIVRLGDEGVEPTLPTVARFLMDSGILQEVGGMEYLSGLRELPLSKATAERYGATIKQKATQARAIRLLHTALDQAQQATPDVTDLADQLEWMSSELRATAGAAADQVKSIDDLPSVIEACFDSVEYLDSYGLLPRGTIVALTGESGGGKSTFALWLVGRLAEAGNPVLYLDLENPPAVVSERCRRLNVGDSPVFKYWGTWLPSAAPQPGSRIVRQWADACDPKPIIVVDSAIAFMDGGDENDASACRKWFAPIRALASSGCTVIILHHSGKSETSKDYRGSSDFKAAVDVGFLLTNWSSDGRLGMVRLNCWKSRFGFTGELSFHYRRGQFELEESTEAVAETVNEKLISIIRTNPGIKTAEFEKLGMAQGLSRPQCRTFLETGVLRGAIETKRVGTNGRAYYLVPETEQPQ